MMHFLQLGASLYVPATRPDLLAIGNGEKYPRVRSVIFCTEDSAHLADVPRALANLEAACPRFEPRALLRFVRVRNPGVLRSVLGMNGVQHLTGFVLPKFTRHNLDDYFGALAVLPPGNSLRVMPTLETAEVFDAAEMLALRQRLLEERHRQRVLSLRIGGNDLLSLLGLRRPRRRSIYSTPLGGLIRQLVTIFRPHGLNLTGPVFEGLNQPTLLAREVRQDLANGLFGKSAVHPRQLAVIEEQYRVSWRDLQAAERILTASAPPVFQLHNSMCEPATHRAWAEIIAERARLYGVRDRATRCRLLPLVTETTADLADEAPNRDV